MNKMLLDLPDAIETARLVVRRYRPGDGNAYLHACLRNQSHLLPYEAGNPALSVKRRDDAEALVREFAADWAVRRLFFFGGWTKESGAFVCQVTAVPVNWELPELEIGYFVDHAWEGKGFVTEAVQAVVRYCFTHLKAHRLRLGCNELNVRSWRVAERCGFVREGYLRQTHPEIRCTDGSYSGDYLYGLLRSDVRV